jgi:Formyl transferase
VNVVLVTHDSVFGRYLAATLHETGAVDRVIVETGGPNWRYYGRKLRRVGPANALFQWWLDRRFRREGRRCLPDLPFPPHDVVANVNGYPFGAEDLVIGFGTSVIRRRTLAAMPHGFLNLHTGWLPDYRGVKSEFWTRLRGDDAHAGWTLHYMSARLDEGDIVLQRRVAVNGERPGALRARIVREAVPVIGEFVGMVRRAGFGAIPRFPQGAGTYYTTPTWRDWRRYHRVGRGGTAAGSERP